MSRRRKLQEDQPIPLCLICLLHRKITLWVPHKSEKSVALKLGFPGRSLTACDDPEHKSSENDVCVSSHTTDAISWCHTALFTSVRWTSSSIIFGRWVTWTYPCDPQLSENQECRY